MRTHILLLLACGACVRAEPAVQPTSSASPDPDEIAVYSAAVAHVVHHGETFVVMDDTTNAGGTFDAPPWRDASKWGVDSVALVEVSRDFANRNRVPVSLPDSIGGMRRVSPRELTRQGPDAWQRFYREHRSIYHVSRPGFDASRTHSVINVSHVCGELCGDGMTLVLTRTESGWTVTAEQLNWIS